MKGRYLIEAILSQQAEDKEIVIGYHPDDPGDDDFYEISHVFNDSDMSRLVLYEGNYASRRKP